MTILAALGKIAVVLLVSIFIAGIVLAVFIVLFISMSSDSEEVEKEKKCLLSAEDIDLALGKENIIIKCSNNNLKPKSLEESYLTLYLNIFNILNAVNNNNEERNSRIANKIAIKNNFKLFNYLNSNLNNKLIILNINYFENTIFIYEFKDLPMISVNNIIKL